MSATAEPGSVSAAAVVASSSVAQVLGKVFGDVFDRVMTQLLLP
jgi:hypothetical protein